MLLTNYIVTVKGSLHRNTKCFFTFRLILVCLLLCGLQKVWLVLKSAKKDLGEGQLRL